MGDHNAYSKKLILNSIHTSKHLHILYLPLSFSQAYFHHKYGTTQPCNHFFPCVARSAERGREAVRKLEGEGLSPQLVTLDVSSEESVRAARQVVEEQYKRVDVLVNNAAVLFGVREVGHVSICIAEREGDVNVLCTVVGTVSTNFGEGSLCFPLMDMYRPSYATLPLYHYCRLYKILRVSLCVPQMCMYELIKNHNSLGHKLDIKQSPNA